MIERALLVVSDKTAYGKLRASLIGSLSFGHAVWKPIFNLHEMLKLFTVSYRWNIPYRYLPSEREAQRRDQMDAAIVPDLCCQCHSPSAPNAGLQFRQLHVHADNA